jgi:hypothetical protein
VVAKMASSSAPSTGANIPPEYANIPGGGSQGVPLTHQLQSAELQRLAMMSQNPQLAPTTFLPWGFPQNLPPLMSLPQNISGSNNVALFQALMMQEILRPSVPVGSCTNDDVLLVQALHDSTKNGQTYKQAIESLNMVQHIFQYFFLRSAETS